MLRVELERDIVAAIRAEGNYGHVTVRSRRGQLYVHSGDETPVARLTPLGEGTMA